MNQPLESQTWALRYMSLFFQGRPKYPFQQVSNVQVSHKSFIKKKKTHIFLLYRIHFYKRIVYVRFISNITFKKWGKQAWKLMKKDMLEKKRGTCKGHGMHMQTAWATITIIVLHLLAHECPSSGRVVLLAFLVIILICLFYHVLIINSLYLLSLKLAKKSHNVKRTSKANF